MNNGYNRLVLVGKITKEPDLRFSKKGTAYAKSSIETEDGANYERTVNLNIILFNKLAEVSATYTKAGDWVLIEGKISSQEQKNKAGEVIDKYIVVVDKLVHLPVEDKPNKVPTSKEISKSISSNNSSYMSGGSEDNYRKSYNRSTDENLTKYLDVKDSEYTPF